MVEVERVTGFLTTKFFLYLVQVTYGFNSCLVGKRWMIIVRLLLG
jgi:hypothetical protein